MSIRVCVLTADAVDNGQNKKAIQIADKILKKQVDLQCAKVGVHVCDCEAGVCFSDLEGGGGEGVCCWRCGSVGGLPHYIVCAYHSYSTNI